MEILLNSKIQLNFVLLVSYIYTLKNSRFAFTLMKLCVMGNFGRRMNQGVAEMCKEKNNMSPEINGGDIFLQST